MMISSATPGWHYAVAYCISITLYIMFNKKRVSWKRYVPALAAMYLIVITFMQFTDGIDKAFFIPCEMFCILVLYLTVSYCNNFPSYAGSIYFCARGFILGEFAASFEWQLYYYSVNKLGISFNLFTEILFLGVVFALVFLAIGFIEKKINAKAGKNHFTIRYRESLIVVGISIVIFTISNLSYISNSGPFSSSFTSEIFIIRTLVDTVGVVVLIAYHLQLQENRTKNELELMQNILHMQYNNYKMSRESIDLINQKYHDLKHQIAILRSNISSEEKLDYLDQMEADIKAYEAQNKTGNEVLDTILTGKSIQCQAQDISITCVADGSSLDFMSPMDISTLFGNGLDNAIESVKKLKDRERRLIHLSVARQKGFLRIRLENCYEGNLVFENGSIVTTKKDKKYHGYGIKSIQSTAGKYGGSVQIKAENGWFELRILIPIGEIERKENKHEI